MEKLSTQKCQQFQVGSALLTHHNPKRPTINQRAGGKKKSALELCESYTRKLTNSSLKKGQFIFQPLIFREHSFVFRGVIRMIVFSNLPEGANDNDDLDFVLWTKKSRDLLQKMLKETYINPTNSPTKWWL